MKNEILAKQNHIDNLYKLAAQRHLYSTAKNLMTLQLIGSIPIIIILSLLLLINEPTLKLMHWESSTLKTIKDAYAVLFLLLDLCIISQKITQYKKQAAVIQESFDCEVFSLPCNEITTILPADEEILINAKEYQKIEPDFNSLINWHSIEIGTLPLPIARIICQRSNCSWDKQIRDKFNSLLLLISISLFLILFIISLVDEFSVLNMLQNIVIPFLPFFIFIYKYRQDQNNAVKRLHDLKEKLNIMWKKILASPQDSNELLNFSRKIQDEIFRLRKINPLIFDWFYKKNKDSQQQSMDYSTAKMSNDYANRLSENA